MKPEVRTLSGRMRCQNHSRRLFAPAPPRGPPLHRSAGTPSRRNRSTTSIAAGAGISAPPRAMEAAQPRRTVATPTCRSSSSARSPPAPAAPHRLVPPQAAQPHHGSTSPRRRSSATSSITTAADTSAPPGAPASRPASPRPPHHAAAAAPPARSPPASASPALAWCSASAQHRPRGAAGAGRRRSCNNNPNKNSGLEYNTSESNQGANNPWKPICPGGTHDLFRPIATVVPLGPARQTKHFNCYGLAARARKAFSISAANKTPACSCTRS